MIDSRRKHLRIARPRCTFAFLLPLLAVLGACATLPDTLPASGALGGHHFSVGVDSEEAAYLMEHYLAGGASAPRTRTGASMRSTSIPAPARCRTGTL